MGRTPWATYLVPGLPQLWRRLTWPALGLALGFVAVVNLLALVTLVWTDILPNPWQKTAWGAVAVVWAGTAVAARRGASRQVEYDEKLEASDSYSQAITYYLKGSWFEAECVLRGLLRRNPRDVDAGLMLATLLRHNGRLDEAGGQLDRIDRFDEAAKWILEIDRERRWLAATPDGPSPQTVEPNNGD